MEQEHQLYDDVWQIIDLIWIEFIFWVSGIKCQVVHWDYSSIESLDQRNNDVVHDLVCVWWWWGGGGLAVGQDGQSNQSTSLIWY